MEAKRLAVAGSKICCSLATSHRDGARTRRRGRRRYARDGRSQVIYLPDLIIRTQSPSLGGVN